MGGRGEDTLQVVKQMAGRVASSGSDGGTDLLEIVGGVEEGDVVDVTMSVVLVVVAMAF